ncbi:hypothetical protein [Petrimonas sulfuriphila]|uniref:hypothetical protein n=1 Tax=Petrimonas sulfuriphila TaxID=285070 RepID=UPI003EB7FC82
MKYKIGEKFNVIIPGISPTVVRIDNIIEKEGKAIYCISFHEERLFTLCKQVPEEVLEEFIDTYNRNKDNLEKFMMLSGDDKKGKLKQPLSYDEKYTGDLLEGAKGITRENIIDLLLNDKYSLK